MSWQVVILILGIFWILPFMYVVKWVFMSRMYRRASLNRGDDLATQIDQLNAPTERFPAEE